jgi:hypothetical protein
MKHTRITIIKDKDGNYKLPSVCGGWCDSVGDAYATHHTETCPQYIAYLKEAIKLYEAQNKEIERLRMDALDRLDFDSVDSCIDLAYANDELLALLNEKLKTAERVDNGAQTVAYLLFIAAVIFCAVRAFLYSSLAWGVGAGVAVCLLLTLAQTKYK